MPKKQQSSHKHFLPFIFLLYLLLLFFIMLFQIASIQNSNSIFYASYGIFFSVLFIHIDWQKLIFLLFNQLILLQIYIQIFSSMFQGLIGAAGQNQSNHDSNFNRSNNKGIQNEILNIFSPGGQVAKNLNIPDLLIDQMVMDKKKKDLKFGFPSKKNHAITHQNAMMYGYNPPIENDNNVICPCCSQNVNTEELPICGTHTTILNESSAEQSSSMQNFFKLTSSVAFFFTFIKYLVVMFLIRFFIVDCFNIISNLVNGGACSNDTEEDCSKNFWSFSSLINKFNRDDLIAATQILSFFTILFLLAYFLLYRRFQYTMYDTIDKSNQTQDDYSIFVEYIPILNFPKQQPSGNKDIQFKYDEDLDELFTNQIRKWIQDEGLFENPDDGSLQKNYKDLCETSDGVISIGQVPDDIVKTITLCYNTSRIDRIDRLRQQIMTKYQTKMAEQPEAEQYSGIDERYDTGPEQVNFLNQTEIALSQLYSTDNSAVFNTTHFVGSAFVSFKYQHYRDHLLQLYGNNRESFMLKGHRLRITEASHPSDIKWENMKITNPDRTNRVIRSYIVLTVFLLFGFGLLVGSDRIKSYFVKKIQEQNTEIANGMNIGILSVTLITTVVTLVINFFLQYLSYNLTQMQQHKSKTAQKLSLIIKLIATQFLNTAMMYYILSIIRQQSQMEMLGNQGLVFQVSSLIVTSGFIQIITNLINIPAVLRSVTIWWFYRDKEDTDEINEFQINLNKKFQYVEFDIAQRYAYYIVQLWTVSFYVYMVPIASPAIAVIFALQYWADKFNLMKRSSLFYQLNYNLSRRILKLSEFSVFLFSMGIVAFSLKFYKSIHPISIAGLIVAIIFSGLSFFLPKQTEKKIFQKYETCETFSYDECEEDGKFQQTYWYSNPATRLVDESKHTKRKVKRHKSQKVFF